MEAVERIAHLEADVDNLNRWQKAQNGTIKDVDKKVDRLQMWIMSTMVTSGLTLLGLVVNIFMKSGR